MQGIEKTVSLFRPSEPTPAGAEMSQSAGAAPAEANGLNIEAQSHLSGPSDIGASHQIFQPVGNQAMVAQMPAVTGVEAAAVAPVVPAGPLPGAETAVLSAAGGGGSTLAASLAGAAGASEAAISPMIQLIMRMPGFTGLANSFFEVLGAFFMPGNLVELFNPTNLWNSFGSAANNVIGLAHTLPGQLTSSFHAIPSGHFPISLSLLPGHAPIFSNLGMHANLHTIADAQMLHGGSTGITATSFNHINSNSLNVSGHLDLHKPQFEGVGSAGGSVHGIDGTLSGPGLSSNGVTAHLAGSQRLFTDQMTGAMRSQTAVASSATNVPATTISNAVPQATGNVPASALNVNGSPFGTDVAPAAQAPATDVGYTMGQPQQAVADTSGLGPSGGVSDTLGGKQLIAYDTTGGVPMGGFSPSASTAGSPGMGGNNMGMGDGAGMTPLRAKQLSFDTIKQSGGSLNKLAPGGHQPIGSSSGVSMPPPGHHAPVTNLAQPAQAAKVGQIPHTGQVHPLQSFKHPTTSHLDVKHHAPAAAPKHVNLEHKQLAQLQPAQPAASQSDAMQAQQTDATQAPAVTDQPSGNYVVQHGDCLWDIAEKQLGDPSRWTEIYKMNSDVIGQNPDLIFSGTELKLPGADGAMNTVADAGKQITVQPGDNLWDLSQKHLGDGSRWGELYRANSDVIGANPRLILPGQQLTIPGSQVQAVASAGGTTGINAGLAQVPMGTAANGVMQPALSQVAPVSNNVGIQPMQGMQQGMQPGAPQADWAAPQQGYSQGYGQPAGGGGLEPMSGPAPQAAGNWGMQDAGMQTMPAAQTGSIPYDVATPQNMAPVQQQFGSGAAAAATMPSAAGSAHSLQGGIQGAAVPQAAPQPAPAANSVVSQSMDLSFLKKNPQ